MRPTQRRNLMSIINTVKAIVETELVIMDNKIVNMKAKRTAKKNHKRLYKMYNESKTTY